MQDKSLPVRVYQSIEFRKNIKKLEKKYRSIEEDIKPLIQQLETGETPGARISGNKYPVFKTRVKNSDNKKGQSGGYRVIFYTKTPEAILLTTIYSKSDKENISDLEIENIIKQEEIEVVKTDPEDFESGKI